MAVKSDQQIFTFSISPFRERVQWISYIGMGIWGAMAIFNWIQRRDPTWGILIGFQIALILLCWRRVFRPLPSTVHSTGSELVFMDVPSFWISVQGIQIPLSIKKEIRIPTTSMALEWISGSLAWNDMEHGKSVLLAQGAQGRALESWLIQQGVPSAVGDK